MVNRIIGFDYLRILCIFAVVAIHSFDTNSALNDFKNRYLGFAVPCFLMISFFLAAVRLSSGPVDPIGYWMARLRRFLPAYLVWTFIYLLVRALKGAQISLSLEAIAGYILFGGAAGHLYYVPLLLAYTILTLIGFQVRTKKIQIVIFTILFAASVLAGFAFPLSRLPGSNAYQAFISYVVYFSPYVSLGVLLFFLTQRTDVAKSLSGPKKQSIFFIFVSFVVIFLLLPADGQFKRIVEILLYSSLLLSFYYWPYGLSRHVERLSKISFGIYLSHHLFVEGAQVLELKWDIDISSAMVTFGNFLVGVLMAVSSSFLFTKFRLTRFLNGG